MELELSGFAKITHHEGAIVCSYETILDLPLEEVQDKLSGILAQVGRFVEEQEGVVGHVKAFARETGRCVSLSTTGDAVQVTPGKQVQTEVQFVAIVFAVPERPLQTLVEELFAPLEN